MAQSKKLDLSKYERLSLGIDIGTSHCEAVVYGKSADKKDEQLFHYTDEPLLIKCMSSLIYFAKDNDTSINYLRKFQESHKLPLQVEVIDGMQMPYVFFDQVEELLSGNKIDDDAHEILVRSTRCLYPIKTLSKDEEYDELESAVIRLNIQRTLSPYILDGIPLDIAFAKPCETGANYNSILTDVSEKIVAGNETFDNRFIIRSEAVFTGHYLANVLNAEQGSVVVCDIGAGTGDVYIFDQDDSRTKAMRTFLNAGNFCSEKLVETLKEYCDVDISYRDANSLKEEHGFITGYSSPKVLKPILADLYINGKPRKVRAGKAIDAAVRPVCQDAVRTVSEIFAEYGGHHPKIVAVTGFMGQVDGLDDSIQEGLGINGYNVTVKNLLKFNESDPRSIVAKGAEHYSRGTANEHWTSL
ncbi:MAG: hypothetical protein COA79_12190 [Planctomycetota bacterium]|nr:MAG: hypothetical protein COA79_12190 [Planctomycetota bacterium]